MPMDYQKLIDQLKLHEGVELTPYLCSEGYWTIGYGRNLESKGLTADEQVAILGSVYPPQKVIAKLNKQGITLTQAEEMLLNDLTEVEVSLNRYLALESLCDARQAVCINMAFNLGIAGFLKFQRTINAIRAQRWEDAAHEMLDSRWAKQVGRRARELAEQMRTGEWQ